ncbi:MAG: hypothetical protein QXK88_09910 [Desulfurococcaceae archaeon]
MVTVAHLEGLFKRYLEENLFECADALYLYAELGKEKASETLWLRYGTVAPLSLVLSDLEKLGVKDLYGPTQDIGVPIRDAVIKIFEHMYLDELVKRVKSRIGGLSRSARATLYLIMRFGREIPDSDLLVPLYELIFQLRVDERSLRRAFEELVACYIFQHPDPHYAIPRFFDKLVPVLESILPKVEVKVTWPESE